MMTLKDLVLALFRGNLKKYRLFIICNILTIAILFSLRLLMDNPYLSDPGIVDPMISSNVFAPTLLMHLFAAFFIPFTMNLLNKQIQKNYGVLLSMGLEDHQLTICILTENALIIAISVVCGMIAGNALERILIFLMTQVIKIDGIGNSQTFTSYSQTAVYLSAVYGISLLYILVAMKRKNIMKIIMEEQQTEEKKEHRILFITGCMIFAVSLAVSYLLYKKTAGNILLVGIAVSYVGMILVINNSAFLLKKCRDRHLFLISDYIYFFRRNAKLCLMMVALYGIIIFVNTVSAATESSSMNNVDRYNPYDLVFSQNINDEAIDMENQLHQYGVTIQQESSVQFFYSGTCAVLGVNDVNQETGTTFHVPEGTYLFVRSNVLNDGYSHERGIVPEQMEIESRTFALYDDIDCLLFCRGGGLTDSLILLNQKDYEAIAGQIPEYEQILRLYRFDDAKKTAGLEASLEQILDSDVASYGSDYLRAEKSSVLLYVLMGYISIVILMSICITFHYKLSLEREYDQKKYNLLISMGAEPGVIKVCISEKITSIVMWPLYITFIWMLLITYINTFSYDYQWIALIKCCSIFLVLNGIMLLISKMYSRRFYKEIIRN